MWKSFFVGVRGIDSASFGGCKGVLGNCPASGVLGRVRRAPLPSSIVCIPSISALRTADSTGVFRKGKFNKLSVRIKCYGKGGRGLGKLRCRESSRVGVTIGSLILVLNTRRSVASRFGCSASGTRTFLIPGKAIVRICTAALRCTPYGTRNRGNFHYIVVLPGKAGRSLAFAPSGSKRSGLLATRGG